MIKDITKDEFNIKKKKFQFFRLMGYFKPYIWLLILSVALSFLVNAAVLIKPYIIKNVIDNYITVGRNDAYDLRLMGIAFFLVVLTG